MEKCKGDERAIIKKGKEKREDNVEKRRERG